MTAKKLAMMGVFLVLVVGCDKQMTKQGDTFGTPVQGYDIPTFLKLPTFQAKVLEKYIDFPSASSGQTNYHVIVFLQKNNAEKLAFTQSHASQNVVDIVQSLQDGHSYIFPDVLAMTNGKAEGISR